MPQKPDFVAAYIKPVNTEIKCIGGHWYLYERTNVYDPKIKRSRKKSGKCLGKITEAGFIPSKSREPKAVLLNDVVEAGASEYFLQRSEEMRRKLQLHFPDCWEKIYVMVLLRTIYGPRFRRVRLHYENSILSYLYPELNFSDPAITAFLKELGQRRDQIHKYMKEMVAKEKRFIIFDGHRLLSASRTMDNAEKGYDSKMRYKPQINLMYIFSLGESTGCPVYYKQYLGSTPDVSAFADILSESGVSGKDYTIVADKGFASDDDFSLIEGLGMKYIIPLKRGNRHVSGRVPASPSGYEEAFSFNGRGIQCITFKEEGFNIHLYLDTDLFSEEVADLTVRTEKHNNTTLYKKDKELKRRSKNKGRLTDEQLAGLKPLTVREMYSDKEEMGTITLKTNRTDLNCFQIYSIFKQRQAVEQFFKTYGDTMDYDASYMRNNYSEEAWLFLNHLSSILGVNTIEEIASVGESKNISMKDLIQTLIKIKACHIDNKWSVPPVKQSVQRLCDKLSISTACSAVLNQM